NLPNLMNSIDPARLSKDAWTWPPRRSESSTRPVFDDEWLAEPLRQPLRHHARGGVGIAARGKADNDAHRPHRIGLRPREARHRRQRGSARCEMQKISAGKFHFEPPSRFISLDHLVSAVGYLYVFAPPGNRTVNTEPLPISLATVTSPPIIRASLRVIARPSPVPPKRCAVEASAWLNSSNNFACCSALHAMPLSATASSSPARPFRTPPPCSPRSAS